MPHSSSDEEDGAAYLNILTPDEVLERGLLLLGWSEKQIARPKLETNVRRYTGMFGMLPCAIAQLAEDLQRTKIADAKIPPEKFDINKLHWIHIRREILLIEKERNSLEFKSPAGCVYGALEGAVRI